MMSILICSKCKGTNIQMLSWVDPNTNEYKGEGPGEMEDNWCQDCQSNVEFEDRKVTHLRYDYMEANIKQNIDKHAQEQMKVLGITYSHNTPQSMGDQYWFWNCENIPDPLPKYLSILDQDPMSCIGYGLSKQEADEIISYVKKDDEHN